MAPLIHLLFTLHLASPVTYSFAPTLSMRSEAHAVAATTSLRLSPSLGMAGSLAPASRAAASAAAAPSLGLALQALRRDEWVSRVAERLNLADLGVTHAAVWLASFPVQVDVAPGHVAMRLTVRMP